MGSIVSTLAFPSPPKELSEAALLRRNAEKELIYLTTQSGHRIPAIYLTKGNTTVEKDDANDGSNNNSSGSGCSSCRRYTLIYSHGNAEDVGLSLPYLDYLSQFCNCHVLAYEYCGYSIAEGESSEQNCYECIQAAYDFLTTNNNGGDGNHNPKVDPSKIVLFGRSLGTGPTVDLAAKLCTKQQVLIAGVILQSPLASAGRCVLGDTASFLLYYWDIFRNYEKMDQLAPIPVFIMHGTKDQVVPCANGKALYQSLTEARQQTKIRNGTSMTNSSNKTGDEHYRSVAYPPLWIPDVGHNDMPEFNCMQSIAKFLKFLQDRR